MALSVVVPLFNEQECLQAFWDRLSRVLEQSALDFEVIFVDDASSDGTWDFISRFHCEDPRVKGIRLTQHAGNQAAFFAGLKAASGDAVVTLDGDLQHPPEKIPDLLRGWREGADLVFGFKTEQQGRSGLKKILNQTFHRLLSFRIGVGLHPETSDFQLLDRALVGRVVATWSPRIFLRAWVHRQANRRKGVPFQAAKRFRGRSKQNLLRLLGVGARSFFFFPSSSSGNKSLKWPGK